MTIGRRLVQQPGLRPGTADIALFGGTGTYTVSNPGSVELETATPVNVHGLTITDPNATLLLSGQISVTNTLLVAAGTFSIANTGVNVFGTEFLNDGTVISANLGGSSSDIASNKFINNSLIDINGDTINADSGLNPEQNTGTIVVGNNGLFDAQDDLSGAGTVDLMSGGTFENFYVGGLSPGMQAGTVDFLDGQGDVYTDWVDTFLSGPAHTLSPAMVDFQPGDTIDFPNMLVSTYTQFDRRGE